MGATTLAIMALSITTLSTMTFGRMRLNMKCLKVTLNIAMLSITTLSTMTRSIKGLYDTQHSAIMLSVVMMSVTFYLLLC
jgi:hypothetical protein